MNIVFFDIDGTLINTGGAGKDAMITAVQKQSGKEDFPANLLVSGSSDRGIGRELFERHGISETDENWEAFIGLYLSQLRENLPQRPGRVLPGVRPLVESLHARKDVLLGLITGNVRASAELKLRHFELWDFFHFGGYGDHHADRDEIARDAMTSADQHANGNLVPDRVCVIGDTPNDVKCARAIGATAIAVATGVFSVDQLSPAKPDVLLADLSQTDAILSLL